VSARVSIGIAIVALLTVVASAAAGVPGRWEQVSGGGVLIWRVGTPATIRFASGAGTYRRVGLAVAPDGRLWGAWSTFRDAARIHTRRSNRRASFFGAPVSTKGPQNAVDAQIIDLSAGGPKLDVLVTYSGLTGTDLRPGRFTARASTAGYVGAGARVRSS
jgi:hypothetical protein